MTLDLETQSEASSDGRRQRSARNRERIVEAAFALLNRGELDPSAARIADEAGVSARTIFRHFEEMDSLYAEMTERIERKVLPVIAQPFTGSNWRENVEQLIGRRAFIYETILAVRVAASLRRYSSTYLASEYQRFLIIERTTLKAVLPEQVQEERLLFCAIENALGFQNWRRMRHDQSLSVEDAEAVVRLTVGRLLSDL